MNSEPLKGKYNEYAKGLWQATYPNSFGRLSQESAEVLEDVRLAVEWLKVEIVAIQEAYCLGDMEIIALIDKAFADVVKEGRK